MKPNFEHKTDRLLPFHRFLRRMLISALLAFGLMALGLGIGVVGYHAVAKLDWIDSILNAAMILTGMGPVAPMESTASKLFASAYALFSGVIFLSTIGLVLAPIFHRILHKFHLDDSLDSEGSGS